MRETMIYTDMRMRKEDLTAHLHATTLAAARLGRLARGRVRSNSAGGPGPSGSQIGRRAAQELARRELARSIYRPSLWQRFIGWLTRLLNGAGRAIPGGWFGLIALAVLAALVISAVIFWTRPAKGGRTAGYGVLTEQALSAKDHRTKAEQLAAAGDFSKAIIERARAIAAELEERQIIPARPGRTAAELAAEAGAELPAQAHDLRRAMALFDDVRYGDRVGAQAGYQQVSDVDVGLRAARPMVTAGPRTAADGIGAPR